MSYLILGASSGLGRELAYILAKNSNDLIIISRDERDLKAIKSDLEIKFKITVKYFVVDASSFDETKKFLYSNLNLLTEIQGILFPLGMMEAKEEILNNRTKNISKLERAYNNASSPAFKTMWLKKLYQLTGNNGKK